MNSENVSAQIPQQPRCLRFNQELECYHSNSNLQSTQKKDLPPTIALSQRYKDNNEQTYYWKSCRDCGARTELSKSVFNISNKFYKK